MTPQIVNIKVFELYCIVYSASQDSHDRCHHCVTDESGASEISAISYTGLQILVDLLVAMTRDDTKLAPKRLFVTVKQYVAALLPFANGT